MTFTEKLLSGYYSANTYEYVSHREAKNDPAKEAQLKNYKSDIHRRDAEFRVDAFAELGITNHPKADLLLKKAHDEGHGNGYQEIFIYMENLVDLIL